MKTYWRCMDCPEWGETSGTESGADAKHVKATGHATVTTVRPLGAASPRT